MGKKFFLNQECERMRRGDVRPKNEETQANRPYSGLPAPERGAATPAEFSVPNGELGLSLGATYTGDYSQLARRINDGIYVKKLPDTAAGPLKVTYDYTHRTVQAHPHSTQEATFVYGSKPIGATNPKIYKELSDRVHDGIYVKILGDEWRSQIAQAQQEFQQQQQQQIKKGGHQRDQHGNFEPTGSMLMLGSAFTGDYHEMARRVQNGIFVKKFTRENDKVPKHLLPYRDHLLPKEYRDTPREKRNECGADGVRERAEGQHRDCDISRSPAPLHNTLAKTPHISQLSFLGGMGLVDPGDYAAMSRRRPGKGLVGKPTSLQDLQLFEHLTPQERLDLLGRGREPSDPSHRDTLSARPTNFSIDTKNINSNVAMYVARYNDKELPMSPCDEMRPRTSGGLASRTKEQRPLTSRESKRPWTSSSAAGAVTDRDGRTHAETQALRHEWGEYLSREREDLLKDAEALRSRNKITDLAADKALQLLEKCLSRGGTDGRKNNFEGDSTVIHDRASHALGGGNAGQKGGSIDGKQDNSGRIKSRVPQGRDTLESQKAGELAGKIAQLMTGKREQRSLSARGTRCEADSIVGVQKAPMTARPDFGRDRSPFLGKAAQSSYAHTRAPSGQREVRLTKTTVGFEVPTKSGFDGNSLGGASSIAAPAHRSGMTR